VIANGLAADAQARGDVSVAEAIGQESEHFALALRQRREGVIISMTPTPVGEGLLPGEKVAEGRLCQISPSSSAIFSSSAATRAFSSNNSDRNAARSSFSSIRLTAALSA